MIDVSWLNGPNSPHGMIETRGDSVNNRRRVAIGRAAVNSQREEGGFETAMVKAAEGVLDAQSRKTARPHVIGVDPASQEYATAVERHEQLLTDQRIDAQGIVDTAHQHARQ